jgi:tetratricopeptide (TPR) repeat protein
VQKRVLVVAMGLGLSVAQTAMAQETALPALRAAAQAAPADLAAQSALGRALIEAGRLNEAEAQMKTVERLGNGSIEALFEARRVDFAGDNYRKAQAGCKVLLKQDKNHVLSHVCMGRAFLVWRRASRAFEHLDRALAIDPNNYEALLAVADARRVQGDFAAAQAAYERTLAVKPSADAYLGLALVDSVRNQPGPALEALRKAHAADGQDPDVLFELGRRTSGTESVALLQGALAGRPAWPEAKLELGLAQLRARDAASAANLLGALANEKPENPLAIAGYGAALVELGKHAEAEPVLQRALKLVPNDYLTALALARLYERTRRYEEAFTQYRGAADLKRESAEPLVAAARLGLELKRPLLSAALLDKALERTPRSAEVLALYGDVTAARGDTKAARDYYQRALAGEGPIDRATVQKKLAALK